MFSDKEKKLVLTIITVDAILILSLVLYSLFISEKFSSEARVIVVEDEIEIEYLEAQNEWFQNKNSKNLWICS